MKQLTYSQIFNGITVYKLVFGTAPFPFWTVVQILWSVYVVQHSYHFKKRTSLQILYELVVSFIMVFATREMAAICFDKPSPIAHHPLSIVIFLFVFSLFELFNLSSKLHQTGIDFAIQFLQSFNQLRLFTLFLRTVHLFDGVPLLAISLILSSLDQILEFIFRYSFKGNETGGSNWKTISSLYIFFSIYWFCVHIIRTRVITTALISGYFHGLICGIIAIFSKPKQKRKKEI